mgnify:FL=1
MQIRHPAKLTSEAGGLYTTLLIVLLVMLGGCTLINKNIDKPLDSFSAELTNSETHYYKILDELGPPAYISSLPVGFAFQYEALSIDEQQLGLSTDMDFIRWFKLAYGKATVKRDVHTFIFNSEGYVQAYGNRRLQENVGRGLSLQFIVKVAPIVDTKYLEKPYSQHNWGFSLLQPLSMGLNRKQSLDSGNYGLEQRGTPTEVGQRTLEFQSTR